MIALLLLTCFNVTVGPGWSEPLLATDSSNTRRPIQFLERDELGRFHLVWAGYNDEHRIAYKMFASDGTTLFPETMISRNVNSVYLSTVTMGDSLFAFWRESDPVYYAIRSLTDGSEITPATHLFTNYTLYPYIRSSPDSLGRLHVLYNDGGDVIYSVWDPAPGSGFTTEYEWVIEGAHDGGVLLVDGDRVHVVVQDPVVHNYLYVQYDLEGNTVVPLTDFTTPANIQGCNRFPDLAIDSSGDLLVIEEAFVNSLEAIYLWKLNGETGELLIDMAQLAFAEPPEMFTSSYIIVKPLSTPDQFYLCWAIGYDINRIFYLVFDSDGSIIHDWVTAYDYSDEEPEDTKYIDGVSDDEGNLYITFCQVETEPQIDYFPTFGWLNHDYLGIEDTIAPVLCDRTLTISQNPVQGGVLFSLPGSELMNLRVFDLSGREVADVSLSDGTAFWNGTDSSGERLPSGVYTVVGSSGIAARLTLLSH